MTCRLAIPATCCFLTLLLTGLPIWADQQAAIVYGSFASESAARQAIGQLQVRLPETFAVAEVDVRGLRMYRVIGNTGADIKAMRSALARVKQTVEPAAWLMISEVEGTQKQLSAAKSYDEPAIQRTLPASVPPSTLSRDPEPVAEPFRHGGSGVNLARITDPQDSSVEMQRNKLLGVQATRDALRVIRYDDDTVNMQIDGRLDEAVWDELPGYNNHTVIDPDSMVEPRFKTITKMFHTDKGLYVGIWNEQPVDTLLPRLTKRDEEVSRDGNYFALDTSGEGLYGFWFDVGLGGSMSDGKVLPEYQFSREWDGPWRGNSAVTDDGYTTEMFLPWSMMSMPDAQGERIMGFYTSRRVAYLDEGWGWPALPKSGSKFMSGLQPIVLEGVNLKQQYAFYPFTASTYDNSSSETSYRIGADIFWRPSTNMQITATLNPDFGTVESDDVDVNLTSFETFFPEKRLFFQEGNEIFITTPRSSPSSSSSGSNSTGSRPIKSSFNPTPTTLVNTRRIGGRADEPVIPAGVRISDVELAKQTELAGAVKLTGQWGQVRYGLLTAFEEDTKFHGTDAAGQAVRIDQDGRDFGVLRFLYETTGRGRTGIGWMSTAVTHADNDAFVHGIDGHFVSPNNKWQWDGQLMMSDVDDVNGYGGFIDGTYIPSRGLMHRLNLDYLDEDLEVTDLGFVRRNDVIVGRYMFMHSTSDMEKLRHRRHSYLVNYEYNMDGQIVRAGLFWRNSWTANSLYQLNTELAYFPARWEDKESEGNGSFKTEDRWSAEVGLGSPSNRKLSASFAVGMRQEELGNWTDVYKGGITYKPNDRLSVDLDFNYFRHDGWLLHQGGRLFTTYAATNWQPALSMDVFLTAKQQIRLTMQWAGIRAREQEFFQIPVGDGELVPYDKSVDETTDNFVISRITAQLRYRWEIAPLSDLFIVYTRGSNLESRTFDDFEDLFHDSLTTPLIDLFVVKLRYRFGT